MGLLLTQPKRKLLKIIGQFSFSTLSLFCNYYSLVCIVPLNIRSELFCANLISNSKAQPLAVLFRPLTKLKSAVKFFVKNLFKLREIWYNVGIENSVIMGCRNAFGRNKPTNKNGVCMYRGFGTERPYFKKDR